MQLNKVGINNQSFASKKDTSAKAPSFGMALRTFNVDQVLLKSADTTQAIHTLATKSEKIANKSFFSKVKSYTDTHISVAKDGSLKAVVTPSSNGIAKINKSKPDLVDEFDASCFKTEIAGKYSHKTGFNEFLNDLKEATKSVKNSVVKKANSFEDHKQQINDLQNGAFITKEKVSKKRK